MTEQFRVVFTGRTLSGAPLDAVKAEAGRVFRLEGAQLAQMFSGKAVVVSRQASADKAAKLLARLQSLDLEARLEPLAGPVAPPPVPVQAKAVVAASDELFALTAPPVVAPVVVETPQVAPVAAPPVEPAVAVAETALALDTEMLCPKCGEGQPKRTLCRRCGTDMPRYHEALANADREAREERAGEIAARRSAPPLHSDGSEWRAGLLGLGFSGRLGCLDYFAGSLVGTLVWLGFVLLAMSSGKLAFSWLGLFLSSLYCLRCLALRLHDTGRSGWLSLVALVPVLGAVMMLILLFVWGDEDENEHGLPVAGGGAIRAVAALLVVGVAFGLTFRNIGQSPEKLLKFVAAASVGQSKAVTEAAAADDDDTPAADTAPARVRYAASNRIDIYLTAACTDCSRMRAWLDANRLNYTVYAVDASEQAAERLHSIIGGNGQVRLPVLEVNGKVLPGNPDFGTVHRQLRQESAG